MVQENLLSVLDIAKELNIGKATTKFLLKRFKQSFPQTMIDGQPFYPNTIIKTLFSIQGQIDMGVLPGDIEKTLTDKTRHPERQDLSDQNTPEPNPSDQNPTEVAMNQLDTLSKNEDIRLSKDGLQTLQSVFSEIGEQQNRIAKAHEKRAEVEERKAVAIEKRAKAEEKKADAMNNIASALQEMNRLRSNDPAAQQIAHQAASVVVTDEENTLANESEELDFDLDDTNEADMSFDSLLDEEDIIPEEVITEDIVPDDIASDNTELIELDDLSALVDQTEDETSLESILETDDLSELLDDPLSDHAETNTEVDNELNVDFDTDIDDLSALLDDDLTDDNLSDEGTESNLEIDDLSKLIDTDDSEKEDIIDSDTIDADVHDGLDDLSALIDSSQDTPQKESTASENDLDDLSALIDVSSDAIEPGDSKMDDLSLLVSDSEPEANNTDDSDAPMDDLSALIDSDNQPGPKDETSPDTTAVAPIQIDISPEDDLGKYKAAVMQVILGLKTEGLSVEETTNRLNANKIKTLSGKPEWGQKAISQVYKFIEAAK